MKKNVVEKSKKCALEGKVTLEELSGVCETLGS